MKIVVERVKRCTSKEGFKFPYDYYEADIRVNGKSLDAVYDITDSRMTIPRGYILPTDEQKKLVGFMRRVFETLLQAPT